MVTDDGEKNCSDRIEMNVKGKIWIEKIRGTTFSRTTR